MQWHRIVREATKIICYLCRSCGHKRCNGWDMMVWDMNAVRHWQMAHCAKQRHDVNEAGWGVAGTYRVLEARLVSSCLSWPSRASPHLSLLLASRGVAMNILLKVKPGPMGHPSLNHHHRATTQTKPKKKQANTLVTTGIKEQRGEGAQPTRFREKPVGRARY